MRDNHRWHDVPISCAGAQVMISKQAIEDATSISNFERCCLWPSARERCVWFAQLDCVEMHRTGLQPDHEILCSAVLFVTSDRLVEVLQERLDRSVPMARALLIRTLSFVEGLLEERSTSSLSTDNCISAGVRLEIWEDILIRRLEKNRAVFALLSTPSFLSFAMLWALFVPRQVE